MMKYKAIFTILLAGALALGHSSQALAQQPEEEEEVVEEQEEAAPAPQTRRKKKRGMKALFKILKAEPTVKDVQKWALRHYKLSPSRINSMAGHARLKCLIPELDLSFENTKGNNFNNMRDGLYPVLPDPGGNPQSLKERTAGTNSNNVFRVRAVWNLDRLVFNAEGLDVKSLNSLGETLVREVATLFYSRRRLLASIILSPSEDPEELFYELTRLDELTATIDSLTGNKFGKKSWQWSESMIGL